MDQLERKQAELYERFYAARRGLLDFTSFTYDKYRINWHHRVVADRLDDVLAGRCKRLMIFQPPRTGKSELVSRRFPAYALGQRPDLKFIIAAYGSDLANSMNRDVQRIMETDDYKALFPKNIIPGDVRDQSGGNYKRTSNFFELAGEGLGSVKSTGVGGSLTGFGFDIGIIDDPVKERKDAESKVIRDAVWDWYTSTFYTRREDGDAAIILTVTRWHEDDLAGRLLRKAQEDPNADQWTVVKLPAICTEDSGDYDPREMGDSLWPAKYSIGDYETIRVNSGARDWNSLYQQSPVSEGGNIVHRDWFRYYSRADLAKIRNWDQIIQSWDFTFKDTANADFVVGGVWGRKGPNKYLLDIVRARMGFVESLSAIGTLSQKWPDAYTKVIEDKANGSAIIDTIKRKVSGVIAFDPGKYGSKEARAHAISGQIEAGNVFLPDWEPWVHDYIEEWVAFPNGKNDDQVDMTTQALLKLNVGGIERLERLVQSWHD